MASKKRKFRQKIDLESFDDFDDYEEIFDEDEDLSDIARDFNSSDWDDDYKADRRMSARRKIERRRDMQRLYSQLDDFEEFGDHANW